MLPLKYFYSYYMLPLSQNNSPTWKYLSFKEKVIKKKKAPTYLNIINLSILPFPYYTEKWKTSLLIYIKKIKLKSEKPIIYFVIN